MDRATLAALRFESEDGSEVSLDRWHGGTVLLVFLRWLG